MMIVPDIIWKIHKNIYSVISNLQMFKIAAFCAFLLKFCRQMYRMLLFCTFAAGRSASGDLPFAAAHSIQSLAGVIKGSDPLIPLLRKQKKETGIAVGLFALSNIYISDVHIDDGLVKLLLS